MDYSQFQEDIIIRIRNLLEEKLQRENITIYVGELDHVAQIDLPCLIITTDSEGARLGATGTDDNTTTVTIKVLAGRKDFLNSDPNKDSAHLFTKYLAAGRDRQTGQYSNASIAGILRKNLQLGYTVNNQEVDVDYGVSVRNQGDVVEEAHVTVVVEETIVVLNRA